MSFMFTAIAGNGAVVTAGLQQSYSKVTAKLQLHKEIRRTLPSALRRLREMTKSTVKPFLVLIAASVLTWAALMAIHVLE
jgi:hypothetical protein